MAWAATLRGYRFFNKHRWMSRNYMGELTVQGFGLIFPLYYLLFICSVQVIGTMFSGYLVKLPSAVTWFFLVLISSAMMGWIDDRWGDVRIKGFKGHLTRFFSDRHITTGLAKAAWGLVISLFVSWPLSDSISELILFTLAMVLSMHLFNLLDVRPGRALKSYWLCSLFILIFLSSDTFYYLFLPCLVATLLLFHLERRRLIMLGDAGALTLGGSFGYLMILHAPIPLITLFVILFIALTLLAERTSLSLWIEKNKWLNRLDLWGVRHD